MSVVTSAVIVVDYAPTEVKEMLTQPQTFGRDGDHMQAFGRLDESRGGGGKMFQGTVYAAGLNHISPQELVKWFEDLPWGGVSNAVLIYDCEGESHTIVSIGDWRVEMG